MTFKKNINLSHNLPGLFFISLSIFPTQDAHDMPVTLKNPFFDLSMLITSPLDIKSRAGIIGDSDLSDEGVCNGDGALRPALPLLEKATVRSSKEVLER